MGHLVQMAGLTVQNFLSAATGIALALALMRAFARIRRYNGRQLLGRHDSVRPSTSSCQSRFVLALAFARFRRAADAARFVDATTLEGAKQTIRRPGSLAGSHQATRHQRRRVLQRQRRAPVREPQRHQQHPVDLVDAGDRRGASLHVRPHGRRPASGLGATRRQAGSLDHRCPFSPIGRKRTAIRS